MQRPLKFATYLPAHGIETHVLAPDDAKWVHRTPSCAYPRRRGSTARGTSARGRGSPLRSCAGGGPGARFSPGAVHGSPPSPADASVTWNLTAIPAAIRIARREGIDAVITTSPPGSVHLVGAAVQRASGARWIADLRDPLVANQHRRDDTAAARARQAANEQVARLVARTRTRSRASPRRSRPRCAASTARTVRVISNGCDFDDFAGLEYHAGSRFQHHAHGKLLREARSAAVPAGLPRRGPRRGCALRRRLPLVGSRLGRLPGARRPSQARRLPPACRVAHRSNGTRRRCCSSSPMPAAAGKGVCTGRCRGLAAAGPSSPLSPPTARRRLVRETGSGVVVAPDDVEGITEALVALHGRFTNGGLPPSSSRSATRSGSRDARAWRSWRRSSRRSRD